MVHGVTTDHVVQDHESRGWSRMDHEEALASGTVST